jgi:phosphoribosylglycinamide formyltransferase 1
MKRIAIFASGSGTNAENIAKYFNNHPTIRIELILSNRANAFVLTRAKKLGIKTIVFTSDDLKNPQKVLQTLFASKIDLVVLAGFLVKVPKIILDHFPEKIINLHPALLPDFGGKGMYGMRVHEAVIDAGKHESGITIHYVDDKYDNGKIIFQVKCQISKKDTPESLAAKIHQLEYKHFPVVIEKLLDNG